MQAENIQDGLDFQKRQFERQQSQPVDPESYFEDHPGRFTQPDNQTV